MDDDDTIPSALRHFAHAAGWKKFEPVWDLPIRAHRITHALPLLEGVLSGFKRHQTSTTRNNLPVIAETSTCRDATTAYQPTSEDWSLRVIAV